MKRRLLLGLVVVVATIWLAAAAFSYFDARHEIDELLDAHLAQSASLIVAQVGHDLAEIELEHAPVADRRARRVAVQIWDRGAILRLHSADAPSVRLSQRDQGYSDASIDGKHWRVFSTWDAKGRFLVQIAERDEARREIAAGIATNLLVPLLVALPILALVVWLGIDRAVEPLQRLGHEVERRRADDLGPFAPEGAPREVLPLVRSLNAMLARVADLIENERRFTADAAHELRTPLAALKTQAQVASGARDDTTRQHALDGVIEGCDRATRLVDQLLTLARLEPDAVRATQQCELAALAREVVAELTPFAVAREVDVELHGAGPAYVDGHADLLSVLVRNLVDNAIRYGRHGGHVAVEVRSDHGRSTIAVANEGPGVAPGDRSRLGQRFFRVLGTNQSGSGLGLSIVRRIAAMHSASLRFEDGEHGTGLRVSVVFPARAPIAPR